MTSQLKFYIDSNRSELRNENGILVPSLNISDFFAIDVNNGELEVITDNLDRELIEDFKIVIMVEDVKADIVASQFRPQIQRASLFVTILDINDNTPQFKEKLYKVMLQENLPKNTEILTVSAEDADKNRTITYNLEAGSFDSLKMLDINPKTGTVFILEKLDFEDQKWLNFTIRATDNGVPSRYHFVAVVVEIDSRSATYSATACARVRRRRASDGAPVSRYSGFGNVCECPDPPVRPSRWTRRARRANSRL